MHGTDNTLDSTFYKSYEIAHYQKGGKCYARAVGFLKSRNDSFTVLVECDGARSVIDALESLWRFTQGEVAKKFK